ncbi:MAG TPA: phosphoenolpyruvate--protein phosphotransferase [Kiloniellales bacterium]|jgi:phosphotransferase system enzyme I (PtsI)|nr:phosphoenolpyruvate--protein phosphotransferase [Kiloniellales bacterium]
MKTKANPNENAGQPTEIRLRGLGVSPGVAVGAIHLRDASAVPIPEYLISASQVPREINRFDTAVSAAEKQLAKLREKAASVHGASAEELFFLLEAHSQMLRSGQLREGVERRVREERQNAEAALAAEIEQILTIFDAIDDPYLRSRGDEVRQVGQRILRHLTDRAYQGFDRLSRNSLVIAEEVTPADTALMDPKRVIGFASVLGGAEGHTAVMARSLGLPAVLGVPELLRHGRSGAMMIIDGDEGLVIIDPYKETLELYRRRRASQLRANRALQRLRDLPAVTKDGVRVSLQANVELPSDVEQCVAAGAEGVGLLRTEYLFMNRHDLPDEEEQIASIRHIMHGVADGQVTVRTLDVGGEKIASALGHHLAEAANPALGLRAVRLSLRVPELLESQLSAALRANEGNRLRILLPMIVNVDEIRLVRRKMEEVTLRLTSQGLIAGETLPSLGVMIEIPGAALAADALAREADFFAIGTNDLIMYTLAIDRSDERVAYLYDPLHPAVLRLIHFAVDAARRQDKPVSVCGEMAGDARYLPFFLGLGIRELSMRPTALPRIKQRLRRLEAAACEELVSQLLSQSDSHEIKRLLNEFNG